MPLLQGEVQLTNLYADCHYYFSPPNTKPVHHRFDKRSYLYLYHDALNRRGRLEIANYAGTPDQDAFNGYLDTADIEYSFKHPTLFTITVQGRILSGSSPAPSPQQDMSQWHLPALDPRNEAKYMYRLHTVDLYLWTTQDADLLLDSLKRVLAPGQLRILDANVAHPEHRDSMSPVVQQLEKAAITTPAYPGQAQRSSSISTTHTTNSGAAAAAAVQTPVSPPSSPPVEQQQQQSFAPMAYNPAAPAKPEPIAHREKTPPPPDAEAGTGLAAAAIHEQGVAAVPPQQYVNPMQQQFAPQLTSGPYTGVPTQGVHRTNTIGQLPGPPGPPGPPSGLPGPPPQSFGSSFAGPPAVAANSPPLDPNAQFMPQHQSSPAPGLARQSTLPTFAQQPQQTQQTQHATYPAGFSPSPLQSTPSFGPGAVPTGGLPSPGLYPGQPAPGAPSPYAPGQPVPGAPSNYSPGQPVPGAPSAYSPGQPAPGAPSPYPPGAQGQQMTNHGYGVVGHGVQHGMHSNVYIPEGPNAKPAQAGPGQAAATGGFEQKLGRFEKGMSKFLKRLDK